MTAKEAHRRAVLLLLTERDHTADASAEDLNRYCFRGLSGVPWSEDETALLLVEMERDGEVSVDWQMTLDGREVVSWVWLADRRTGTRSDQCTVPLFMVKP